MSRHDGTWPEELVTQILLNLSPKSLIRFQCLSKPFAALIASPQFVHSHLGISRKRPRLMVHHCHGCPSDIHSRMRKLLFLDEALLDLSHSEIKCGDIVPKRLWGKPHVLVCDGLIFLIDSEYLNFALLNPSTREFRYVPRLYLPRPFDSMCCFTFGFGVDQVSNDYKVIFIRRRCSKGRVLHFVVYSMTTDSWRELDHTKLEDIYDIYSWQRCNSCINGAYYWVDGRSSNKVKLVAFRFSSEEFEAIQVPDIAEPREEFLRLFNYNGCLALCVSYDRDISHQYHMFEPFTCHDIWVMENEGHWTKQFKIGPLFGVLQILGFWKKDQLLLTSTDDKFLLFDIVTGERRDPSIRSETETYAHAFEYQETLVTINSRDRSDVNEPQLTTGDLLEKCRWKPPQPSFVKINTAEAYVAYNVRVGIGFVIRDELGKVIHVGGRGHVGRRYANLEAVERGLRKALKLNLTKVEVEMDDQRLVKAISQGEKLVKVNVAMAMPLQEKLVEACNMDYGEAEAMVEVIRRIRWLARKFTDFSISATNEAANSFARMIADFCTDNAGEFGWTFNPPSSFSLLDC